MSRFNFAISACNNHQESTSLTEEQYTVSSKWKEKAAQLFQSSRVLHRFGWNKDIDFFQEVYSTANSKNFDLHQMTKADYKRFKWELADRESWIDKGWGKYSSAWKVLNANLKRLPGGTELQTTIRNIQAYHRESVRISNDRIHSIMNEVASIGKDLNIDMTKLERLESGMMGARNNTEKQNALNEISRFLGTINSEAARTEAGNLYLSVRDVLEGTPISELKRQVKAEGDIQMVAWNTKTTESFRRIQDNWFLMRRDLAKTLINAIRSEKRLVSNIDISQGGSRRLTEYLDRLESYIKEIEFTQSAENTGRKYDLTGREVHEYGLNGNKSWQLNTDLGYMPHYVLDIAKDLQQFSRFAHNVNESRSAFDVFKDQLHLWESDRGVLDRLRSRGAVNQEYYSRNPLLFLNKYAHEVASYNHNNLLKESFQSVFNRLIKAERTAESLGEKESTSMFLEQASEKLNILREDLMGTSLRSDAWYDKMSRGITAYSFQRTMGWSWRSAIRNWGQLLIEKSVLGWGSKKQSEKILRETDAKIAEAKERERHGLLWAKDSTFLGKLQEAWKGLGKAREGTQGQVNIERDLMPGLKEVIDSQGNVRIELEAPTAMDRVLETMEKYASASSVFHSAIESYNRSHTFKTAFARAYDNLKNKTPEWFIKQEMGQPNATRKQQMQWISQLAGKLAFYVSSDVHFEYSKAEKASIFKGPAGKVIGQFQHYRMSLFDLQWNLLKRGTRDIFAEGALTPWKGLKRGEYARQALRYQMTYQLIDVATMVTGWGFSNLFNNENLEWIKNHISIITAERDSEGGLTDEGIKQIEDASFGKGLLSDFGASVGAVLDLGEVMGLYKVDNSSVLPYISAMEQTDISSLEDEDRLYKGAKLLNIQASRFFFKTVPSMVKGNYNQALLQELGLFMPYDLYKRRKEGYKEFYDWVQKLTGYTLDMSTNRGGPRGPRSPRRPSRTN